MPKRCCAIRACPCCWFARSRVSRRRRPPRRSRVVRPRPRTRARQQALDVRNRIFRKNRSCTVPHAIRIHATGGPEVMQWEEVAVGEPGPGQARVRHTAIGVNFIDTYHRGGLYPLPLPTGLGNEAAGIVEAVGSGVDWIKPGDRVASGTGPLGAYSTARVVPADRLVTLPEHIDDRTAAAL